MWLERSKDLDRELYGIVKWCNPKLSFGLNVWNRNHFNPIRKAQWSWEEQTDYADWVKPITYQHQSGLIFDEGNGLLPQDDAARLHAKQEFMPAMYSHPRTRRGAMGLGRPAGMDPDTYVFGQCADAVRGCKGKAEVYMGIGVDAPRVRATRRSARRTSSIAACMRPTGAGGEGMVYSPNYAGMNLSNLDGGARALEELGLKPRSSAS